MAHRAPGWYIPPEKVTLTGMAPVLLAKFATLLAIVLTAASSAGALLGSDFPHAAEVIAVENLTQILK